MTLDKYAAKTSINYFSSLFATGDVLRGGTSATQWQKSHTDDVKSVRNPVFSAIILFTNNRQKATKVEYKRKESVTKQSIVSQEEAFEFCWSLLVDEHNTLPKLTRRHVKLDNFIFGTPWLPYLLCKHWFASSVWNFWRWVADVPPCETSPAAKNEEKRMFLQATR